MLHKKHIVITGATGGIGNALCNRLINDNCYIIALCRTTPKQTNKNIQYINGDLDNVENVIEFTKNVILRLPKGEKIDILYNNAGIIAPNFKLNKDGFETSLFVNFVAPVIITQTLLPYLANEGRIINTLSCTINAQHAKKKIANINLSESIFPNANKTAIALKELTNILQLNSKENFKSLINYSITKRLLAFYTAYLYNTEKKSFGADPGVVNTGIITQHKWYDFLANIFFRPFIKSPQKGSLPLYNAGIEQILQHNNKPNNLIIFKGNKQYSKTL